MAYSDDDILVTYETEKASHAAQAYCRMMNATILNGLKRQYWVSALTYYGQCVTCVFHVDDHNSVTFTCDYFKRLYLGRDWHSVVQSLQETFKDVKVEVL